MGMLLFLIGGLGVLVSLGLLIANFFRKKPKKKALISIGVFFLMFAVGLSIGPDAVDDTAADEVEEVDEPVKVEKTSEPIKEESKVEKVEESSLDQGDLEKASLAIVRDNFEGMATVEYDSSSKSYNVLPVDQALINELMELVMGNKNMLEGWESLVGGMTNLSASIKDTLGSGYVLNLLNPANTENVLLTCVDGVIFYNVADDL